MSTTQTIEDIAQAEQGTSLWKDAWLRLRQNHLAVFGLVVLVLFIVIALLTPWIAPYSYQAQDLELGASPPSAAHWLGTDIFGRDLMTQIMYGGRISLAVGFVATAVGDHLKTGPCEVRVRWGRTRLQPNATEQDHRQNEGGKKYLEDSFSHRQSRHDFKF